MAVIADAEHVVPQEVWSAFLPAARGLARRLGFDLESVAAAGRRLRHLGRDVSHAAVRRGARRARRLDRGTPRRAVPADPRRGSTPAPPSVPRTASGQPRPERGCARRCTSSWQRRRPCCCFRRRPATATPLAATEAELAAIRPATLRLTSVAGSAERRRSACRSPASTVSRSACAWSAHPAATGRCSTSPFARPLPDPGNELRTIRSKWPPAGNVIRRTGHTGGPSPVWPALIALMSAVTAAHGRQWTP